MSKNKSTFSLSSLYDYQKHASSVMKKQDAEIAFMKASSTIIEDKAAPIFKDPYYLGFEIVKTNDSFTKMVGIYIFRINKNFLYAPVFYLDGRIKGTDLLYNVSEKLFCTLNPEWCDYFLSNLDNETGKGVTNAISDKARQTADMQWLAYPQGGMGKAASTYSKDKSPLVAFDLVKTASNDFEADLNEAYVNWCKEDDTYRPLYNFIKSAGFKSIETIHNTVNSDLKFANNMARLCDIETMIPRDVLEAERSTTIKTASANYISNKELEAKNNKRLVAVHTGMFNLEGKKFAKSSEEQMDKGYVIEDNREAKDISDIYADIKPMSQHLDVDTISKMDESIDFTTVDSDLGIHNVVTNTGETVKCLIVRGNNRLEKDRYDTPVMITPRNPNHLFDSCLCVCLDDKYKGLIEVTDLDQYVTYNVQNSNSETLKNELDKYLHDVPAKGNVYVVYDKTMSYLSPHAYYIKAVNKTVNNGYDVDVLPLWSYDDVDIDNEYAQKRCKTIKINPNANTSMLDLDIYSKATKWIELPSFIKTYEANKGKKVIVKQSKMIPGNVHSVQRAIESHLDMTKSASAYCVETGRFDLNILGNSYKNLTKLAAVCTLMVNSNVREKDAEQILINTEIDGNYEFLHKKFAQRIILNPDDDFYEGFDSDLNIKTEFPQTKVLMTEGNYETQPNPRYGDKIPLFVSEAAGNLEPGAMIEKDDNKLSDAILETADANSLANLAQGTGKPSLFEHGIIGSLSKINEAVNYIEDFIPDMRRGLDKFGRLLFLITVKPQDFVEKYGGDELEDLENSVLTVFKQTGDLVLKLLKKTTKESILHATNKTDSM